MLASDPDFVLQTSSIGPALPLFTGYQDLEPTSRGIRIAELLPASLREATGRRHASCRLANVSFGICDPQPHPYTALSYTWGDPTRKAALHLNDMFVEVRENLSEALEHLEQDSSSIRIWADAICINQEDTLEKGQQVAMMPEIFGNAEDVLVWLGPSDSEFEDPFEVLRQMGNSTLRLSGQQRQLGSTSKASEPQDIVNRSILEALKAEWCPDDVLRFDIESAQRVLQRPWFRRVWVLQEAALNENVTFRCGRYSIPKEILWAGTRAMTILANEVYGQTNTTPHSALAGANFISRRTLNFAARVKTNSYSLESLLMEISSNLGECAYQATDPRDRIFAVLGFLSDTAASTVRFNYAKTCGEVYIEVAENVLSQSLTLDILYAVSSPKNVKAIPSWVPDWSVAVSSTYGPRNVGRFSAAGRSSRSSPILTSDKYGNRLLVLSGYSFDSISAVMEVQWDPRWEIDLDRNGCALKFIDALRNFGRHHKTAYPSDAGRMEALWKTPIADSDAFSDVLSKTRPPASPRMRRSFESFVGTMIWKDGAQRKLASAAYVQTMNLQSARRRLFLTSKGYYGLGQESLRRGDRIVLLSGGDSPFIVREAESLGYFELVGEAYVHGIMQGEHLETKPLVERFIFC